MSLQRYYKQVGHKHVVWHNETYTTDTVIGSETPTVPGHTTDCAVNPDKPSLTNRTRQAMFIMSVKHGENAEKVGHF